MLVSLASTTRGPGRTVGPADRRQDPYRSHRAYAGLATHVRSRGCFDLPFGSQTRELVDAAARMVIASGTSSRAVRVADNEEENR